jgi:hypothetical protein
MRKAQNVKRKGASDEIFLLHFSFSPFDIRAKAD